MKKNIIAFLTVIALIVCMIPSVFAVEAAGPALTVTANAASVAPGGSITVSVALTNNTNNVCGEIELTASEGLTLVDIEANEDFFTFDVSKSNKIVYTNIDPYTTATVALFTATFAVDPEAADGDYTITATAQGENGGSGFYNADGDELTVSAGSATVAVVTPAAPTLTVNPSACFDDTDYYSVEGQVVTVTYDKPCKVGYWDGTKYVAIAAVASGNSYTFTAPAGVTEVILVVKGEIDGTGLVNAADKLTLARSLLPTSHNAYAALTAEQEFAANIDGVGTANAADKLTMARSLLPTSHNAYAALAW